MPSQILRTLISPAQRFLLWHLCHKQETKIAAEEGRTFRRFLSAFNLWTISHAAKEFNGVAVSPTRDEKTQNLVELTLENAEYALKVWTGEHSPAEEELLGELMDKISDFKAGLDVPQAEGVAIDPEQDRLLWLPAGVPGSKEN